MEPDVGFLHRGIDSADPQVFWTRFEDVDALEARVQAAIPTRPAEASLSDFVSR